MSDPYKTAIRKAVVQLLTNQTRAGKNVFAHRTNILQEILQPSINVRMASQRGDFGVMGKRGADVSLFLDIRAAGRDTDAVTPIEVCDLIEAEAIACLQTTGIPGYSFVWDNNEAHEVDLEGDPSIVLLETVFAARAFVDQNGVAIPN